MPRSARREHAGVARSALGRHWRRVGRRIGHGLALAVAGAGLAQALEFRVEQAADRQVVIAAEGSILPGDAGRLASLLPQRPKLLVLRSDGGLLAEGMELAALVQRAALPVLIPAGATCASACFLLLAASPQRFAGADARIGVHSAASPARGEDRDSLAATTLMAREAERLGVPPHIIIRMIGRGPGGMAWLDAQDFAAMGIKRLAPAAAPPPSPSKADSFGEGRRDRAAWEAWLMTLSPQARAGARYWAALGPRRPGASCGGEGEQFRQGCLQAGELGAAFEARAAWDTGWRSGWDREGGPTGYAW